MKDRGAYFAAYRAKRRDKAKAYAAAWRTKNKEKERVLTAAYREANREVLRARGRSFYRKHAEKRKLLSAQYKKDNPRAYRIYHVNRRIRASDKLSPGIVDMLWKRQDGLCCYCDADLTRGFHIDHVQPLSIGGRNVDSNVQLLCPPCNIAKGAMPPEVFKELRACS